MTDYLEESLDHASQLLEQVRKLERELPGLEPENGGAGEGSGADILRTKDVSRIDLAVYNTAKNVDQDIISVDDRGNFPEIEVENPKNIVNRMGNIGEELELLRQTAVSPAGEPASRTDIRRETKDGPEREEEALAAQLERLDRASVIPAGKARGVRDEPGGRESYPVSLSRPQGAAATFPAAGMAKEAWPTAGPEQGRASSGGETGWAEQADRAFRRDSRRYDGGFYLY